MGRLGVYAHTVVARRWLNALGSLQLHSQLEPPACHALRPPSFRQVRDMFAQVRDDSFVDINASGTVEEVHTRVSSGALRPRYGLAGRVQAGPDCCGSEGRRCAPRCGAGAPGPNNTIHGRRTGPSTAKPVRPSTQPPLDPLQVLVEAQDVLQRCREGQPILTLWQYAPLSGPKP